ncbi:unnamed protein product [Rotaria sp. Silwood1]|nr:unnamed protein product [Rotaria sp. Silwood1]
MSDSTDEDNLRKANFRLCRICKWSNYTGLGFSVGRSTQPPQYIQLVDSNSPACATGLKIRDVVLAVNGEDVSEYEYEELSKFMKTSLDNNDRLELLVIQKRVYDTLNEKGISFNPRFAKVLDTPKNMPLDYKNFPKNIPRTCEIRLNKIDETFGFNIAYGKNDIGVYIQEVAPNSPASKTTLRKSDRILEINDKFVDKESSKNIEKKLIEAKSKRYLKLYVVDTHTYTYFEKNKIPLESKKFKKSSFAKTLPQSPYEYIEENSSEENNGNDYIETIPSLPNVITSSDDQHSDNINIETEFSKGGALAGVKPKDRSIEINDVNVEDIDDAKEQEYLRNVKNPQSSQPLVPQVKPFTYDTESKTIPNSKPENVKYLSNNKNDSFSPKSSSIREVIPKLVTTITPVPVQKSSTYGIKNLLKYNPLETQNLNRQRYELRPNKNFPDFGIHIHSTEINGNKHKITKITQKSPAEEQGLRVGHNIIAINNQNVQHMNATEFKQFYRAACKRAYENDDSLDLEIIDEDLHRSQTSLDDTDQRKSSFSTSSTSTSTSNINEDYPKLRHCTIRSWPQYQQLGFKIIQSSYRKGGYQIQQLEKDSPAARTNVYNDDYIIEVDGVNIEKENYQYVQDLIRETYKKKQKIELLLIDEKGYQWYKHRQYGIIPFPNEINVVRYRTPDPPPMVTPNDTNSTRLSGYPRSNDNTPSGPQKIRKTYATGYDPISNYPYSRVDKHPKVVPSLFSSQEHLSRGTVDIVSDKRLLRLCRVQGEPYQVMGFEVKLSDNKHIIHNIQPNSPAARSGLNENDRLIGLNDEYVLDKSIQGKKHSV